MNGTRARALRRLVYGDTFSPRDRTSHVAKKRRNTYQQLKRAWRWSTQPFWSPARESRTRA